MRTPVSAIAVLLILRGFTVMHAAPSPAAVNLRPSDLGPSYQMVTDSLHSPTDEARLERVPVSAIIKRGYLAGSTRAFIPRGVLAAFPKDYSASRTSTGVGGPVLMPEVQVTVTIFVTSEQAAASVSVPRNPLPPGARLLSPCGFGRHCVGLTQRVTTLSVRGRIERVPGFFALYSFQDGRYVVQSVAVVTNRSAALTLATRASAIISRRIHDER